jgi:hypothetical protein
MSKQTASRRRYLAPSFLIFLLALLLLVGCSSGEFANLIGHAAPSSLIVPDLGNNRVLIYQPPFATNMNASVVLGQPDFAGTANGTTASTMNSPSDVTLDPSGNLYVAENSNCRVTQFRPPFTDGMNASLELGQADLTTANCNPGAPPPPSATNLMLPLGVASTSNGTIVVADHLFDRVLLYTPPLSSAMAATTALGQPNLTTSGCSTTATGLCEPSGVALDAAGNLWVADSDNNRVVRYSPPFSSNMSATLELGQPSGTAFTSGAANNGGISASTLNDPLYVVVDASGAVWVADQGNNRVLKFAPPFTNGMDATVVLGQPNFTSSLPDQGGTPAANTLSGPEGLQFASDGSLFVGDSNNNRTLRYLPPFANGMNATAAIGQPDLTSTATNQGGAAAANTQDNPFGAGPSLIALAVFLTLVAGWGVLELRRRRKQVTA